MLKNQRLEGNTVDPDETAHYEPSHLDLQCLQIQLLLCNLCLVLYRSMTCTKKNNCKFELHCLLIGQCSRFCFSLYLFLCLNFLLLQIKLLTLLAALKDKICVVFSWKQCHLSLFKHLLYGVKKRVKT